ncbi:hypothetical protein NDI44_22415 [Trichocoleus sp. DQ-A3]|uniref:hypothetical protein n=1 Tax=Cyanophyceae TaxID=3028117 RepID=UPI0016832301|nr:hypothetical protein [Coleofasciculus sp. FACHB-125]MBD1903792.1 hypothetical protein [Coleofasciculus sp. FACHB-125]
MAQKRPIRFTPSMKINQLNCLPDAVNDLDAYKFEMARPALEKYLNALDSFSHQIRTPVA